MKAIRFVTVVTAFISLVYFSPRQVIAGSLIETSSPAIDNAVVATYDPADGSLSVDGNGVLMTTFEFASLSSGLDPSAVPDGLLQSPFDLATQRKVFHLNTAGFESIDFGTPLASDLTARFLIDDLDVDGSIMPAGGLDAAPGGGPYLYVVPEPASGTIAMIGVAMLLLVRRRTARSATHA